MYCYTRHSVDEWTVEGMKGARILLYVLFARLLNVEYAYACASITIIIVTKLRAKFNKNIAFFKK